MADDPLYELEPRREDSPFVQREKQQLSQPLAEDSSSKQRRRGAARRWPDWVHYMLAGALLSPVLTLTPFLQYVTWILSSIIHEGGHTAFAWFVGCPRLPINLTGHAMTTYSEQRFFLCLIVWGLLAWAAVEAWRHKTLTRTALGLFAIYPVLAFIPLVRETGFLLSGHLGELTVAGIFLWQARTGLFVRDQLDRMAYRRGLVSGIRQRPVMLRVGFCASVLSWYRTSGSYQLTNDTCAWRRSGMCRCRLLSCRCCFWQACHRWCWSWPATPGRERWLKDNGAVC